jgi:hypothetical protein
MLVGVAEVPDILENLERQAGIEANGGSRISTKPWWCGYRLPARKWGEIGATHSTISRQQNNGATSSKSLVTKSECAETLADDAVMPVGDQALSACGLLPRRSLDG